MQICVMQYIYPRSLSRLLCLARTLARFVFPDCSQFYFLVMMKSSHLVTVVDCVRQKATNENCFSIDFISIIKTKSINDIFSTCLPCHFYDSGSWFSYIQHTTYALCVMTFLRSLFDFLPTQIAIERTNEQKKCEMIFFLFFFFLLHHHRLYPWDGIYSKYVCAIFSWHISRKMEWFQSVLLLWYWIRWMSLLEEKRKKKQFSFFQSECS